MYIQIENRGKRTISTTRLLWLLFGLSETTCWHRHMNTHGRSPVLHPYYLLFSPTSTMNWTYIRWYSADFTAWFLFLFVWFIIAVGVIGKLLTFWHTHTTHTGLHVCGIIYNYTSTCNLPIFRIPYYNDSIQYVMNAKITTTITTTTATTTTRSMPSSKHIWPFAYTINH